MNDMPPGTREKSPVAQRPTLPDGYNLPDTTDGMLAWEPVQARLVAALHYWMATVRPDGRPHLIPRWGVWLDGRFFYDGSAATRHARNLQDNPHVALSLEDGMESVIVEGVSQPSRADPDGLGARLATAFEKYHDLGFRPGPDSWSDQDGGGLRVVTPRCALAWFSFPTDCTRFTWD